MEMYTLTNRFTRVRAGGNLSCAGGGYNMNRTSRFTRRFGIALAIVGVLLIAFSGYYLYGYMQSGSDAELFNVDAAAPDRPLELLGQDLPLPDRYYAASGETSSAEAAAEDGSSEVSAEPPSELAEDTTLKEASSALEQQPINIASVLLGVSASTRHDAPPVTKVSSGSGPKEVPGSVDDARAGSASLAPESSRLVVDFETSEPVEISSSKLVATFASIYPGGSMNPRYWSAPHWAGNMPFGGPTIPEGFIPVDASDFTNGGNGDQLGQRIRIPTIALDATVSELEILELGDARSWSTPNKVVGHIPTTANPGEMANGWYFGHLESTTNNEGNIFRRLPEIAQMIQNDPVDVFITTSEAEYMYRVTGTRQLHRSELSITDSSNAQITLVTCWPVRIYDQRIVVSAVLIAVKPLQSA